MASVQINRGTTEEINATPITDGLISFDKDSNLIYMDSDGNRVSYGGGKQKTLTQAEYNRLSHEEKNNGTVYYISDGLTDSFSANVVDYDNTDSGLDATNVQSAIDEVVENTREVFKGTLAECLLHYGVDSIEDFPDGSQTVITDMGANGTWYGTQLEYDELPNSKFTDGVIYCITDGVSDYLSAENIKYGNSDVGSALDGLDTDLGTRPSGYNTAFNSIVDLYARTKNTNQARLESYAIGRNITYEAFMALQNVTFFTNWDDTAHFPGLYGSGVMIQGLDERTKVILYGNAGGFWYGYTSPSGQAITWSKIV